MTETDAQAMRPPDRLAKLDEFWKRFRPNPWPSYRLGRDLPKRVRPGQHLSVVSLHFSHPIWRHSAAYKSRWGQMVLDSIRPQRSARWLFQSIVNRPSSPRPRRACDRSAAQVRAHLERRTVPNPSRRVCRSGNQFSGFFQGGEWAWRGSEGARATVFGSSRSNASRRRRLLAGIGYQLCAHVRVVLDNGLGTCAFWHSTMSRLRVGSISGNFR